MREAIGHVGRHHHIAESFNLFVFHQLPEGLLGSYGLAGSFREITLHERNDHHQTLAGFELRHQREQFAILGREIVVHLGQHEDLRSPVLGVRWAFL